MKSSIAILFSFAANIVLAVVLFRHAHEVSLATMPAAKAENPATTGASVVAAGHSADDQIDTSNENTVATTARFSWRDLQAENLKEFVRKLRAVNCPEETIKDLVLAEVHRRYARQTNPLWLARDGQRDYWASYRQKFDLAEWKKNRERLQQIRGLQKDETALIVEIFGVDVDKQRLKEEGIDNESRGWNLNGDLAWLPESKRGPVEKYLEDCQDKAQEFYASVRGGWDAETRAKEKQLEAEKLAGLAQFLTPQEVREYELRNSQTASQIASDLHGVSISREQYEALFDVRNKYGDSIYNYSDDANDAGAIAQIEQNKKDMQAEIAAAMGTDKASELERVQDFSYQALAGLARHNDLPADTAPKIYDYKQTAEKAVQDLDANLDLTPDQRQAALQQIRAETEQSVRTALGDKLYKRYLKNEGWWIHNLAPTADK